MTEMNLLETTTDSHGREVYCIRKGVSGTTAATAQPVIAASQTTSAQSLTEKLSTNSEATVSAFAEEDIKLLKRETFAAFIGLLAFDLLLKFGGFRSLIKKVERWPTAKPRTTDWEICRRVRAMVDQAQMYYPKKAMCLQHSAVVTCLLRRRGVPAEMVLAAHEFPVRIHAWSEVEGMVVNDFQSVRTKHKEMRRL